MKKLSQLFLQGLLAITPIVATLAVLFWLGTTAEATLGRLLKWMLPQDWYWPGLGILFGIAVITGIGLLLNAWIFRKLADLMEGLFSRIPLVKTIYSSIRDIAKFAAPSEQKDELQKAVAVTIDDDIRLVGFITGQTNQFSDEATLYSVYLPMSYQIGGYTVLLPESRFEKLDMSVQDAMRYVLTAGMAQTRKNKDGAGNKKTDS